MARLASGGAILVILAATPLAGATGVGHATPQQDPVVLAAGDIAGCAWSDDEATAALLDANPGQVAALGDQAYEDGTPAEFTDCYDPTWGRARARTRPTPGNHDYHTAGAAGYFGYFGTSAGDPAKGYYSYELGSWHVVVLNSNCAEVGGCNSGSPQEQWLRADLAASTAPCTLAYWHHPRFSSGGDHGSSTDMGQFWQDLYASGAEIVLSAHDHDYERFAPQDPLARPDGAHGLREFVVGTGGAPLAPFDPAIANSEVRDATTHGVLKLTLGSSGYSWQFLPVAGGAFTDSGTGSCHGAPRPPPVLKHCAVPHVVGLRLARARTVIRRASCAVGPIRHKRSRRIGLVLSQSPRAGLTRPAGARIVLVVGR